MFRIVEDDGPFFIEDRDVRDETSVTHGVVGWETSVSLIQTQVNPMGGSAFRNLQGIQQRLELGHIMAICAAHDER